MYEAFYGLREKPFSILPDPDLIYWGQNHRLAYAMLEFGVMNRAGFKLLRARVLHASRPRYRTQSAGEPKVR